MSIDNYINEMRRINAYILEFLEKETNYEEDFDNLKDFIINTKICQDKHIFKSFLYMLSKISSNYHRDINFFNKIERILINFKTCIKNFYSNSEIFNIFKNNKRILLFLLQEELIIIDSYIVEKMYTDKYYLAKYPQYFAPEIQKYINGKSDQYPDDFYKKRKIGENDNYICQIIRNDLIDEFIPYITKESYRLNSIIDYQSIFETNSFLLKKPNIKLIEYAAFFGSIQIFNYLRLSGAILPETLWLYTIHSRNAEIIHLLEENQIKPKEGSYLECLIEAIKCHHNDFYNYIQDQYFSNKNDFLFDVSMNCLKYYNFAFVDNKFINKSSFYYLCKHDYYILVNALFDETDADINSVPIKTNIFFNIVLNYTFFIEFEHSYFNKIFDYIILIKFIIIKF